MSDGFYRAFEERYRGSRELIKGRLVAYRPFVEPLLEAYPSATALDLGCGRGEWLELLVESGFKPIGVDLDKGMLEACLERGLPVEQGDALAYLSALPDGSQAVVSAFHVVEHITFDQLGTLVAETLRVLMPGGLLIMETPNPENIVVATRNFYLDPTHQRPIPPMLLAFVAEFAGFARVKTLRLQESKDLVNRGEVSLQDVFAGASPDYAVVAQKHAPEDFLALTAQPFSLDYGLSLEILLSRWDSRFNRLEAKAQQAEAASNERLAQLQAVYASSSWKITRPLRGIKRLISGDFAVLGQSTAAAKLKAKQTLRHVIAAGISYVNTRPVLRNRLKRLVAHFPWLRQRLVRVALNSRGVLSGQRAVPLELQNMTPRARKIYQDLKAAIENKNKGAV
jgi:O-antigen chain-terminating methyltransferase